MHALKAAPGTGAAQSPAQDHLLPGVWGYLRSTPPAHRKKARSGTAARVRTALPCRSSGSISNDRSVLAHGKESVLPAPRLRNPFSLPPPSHSLPAASPCVSPGPPFLPYTPAAAEPTLARPGSAGSSLPPPGPLGGLNGSRRARAHQLHPARTMAALRLGP